MKVINFDSKTDLVEFTSIYDFLDYIEKTPVNEAFKNEERDSMNSSSRYFRFSQTHNFMEAKNLLKNGWTEMAENLTQRFKVEERNTECVMKQRNVLGVAGYQAIVPLYLNGSPNNMISKKLTPVKQRVLTLNKYISYTWDVKTDTIVNESVKVLRIIKKLEAQGYRCNLNVIIALNDNGVFNYDKRIIARIKIKSANEKLNVSKMAFPLVHPSMFRRLFFKFLEVYPGVTKDFVDGYGYPLQMYSLREVFGNKYFNGEYLLPNFIYKNVEEINSIEDLEKI